MKFSAGSPRSWPGSRKGQAVYADVNGLKMFYEIRGPSGPAKVPAVLLHGAIFATGNLIRAVAGSAGPSDDRT
jgi:hypothetical protein